MARQGDVKPRCRGSVHNDYGAGFHQCLRRASVERDGKRWCGTHDPQAETRRRDKRQGTYDAKQRADDAIKDEAAVLCQQLGVTGHAHYDAVFAKGYTPAIVISFVEARRLAEALAHRPTVPPNSPARPTRRRGR